MTTQPGDDTAGKPGRGHLRASHADREEVIGVLKAAFVQGMLGKDEFDLRMDLTFVSRTCAELAALTADLPAGLAAAQSPQPARVRVRARVLRPVAVLTAATAVYAAMWPLALSIHTNMEGNPGALRRQTDRDEHSLLLVHRGHGCDAGAQFPAGQAFRRTVTAAASTWRGRPGIPAPAISWPGQAAPADWSRSAGQSGSCAGSLSPPAARLAGTVFRALRPVAEVSVMAELRDQMPADAGREYLRASHADREQAIEALKAAYVAGMLGKDEFDLRVGQTLASRTYADLAAVTADLPAALATAGPARPPARVRRRPLARVAAGSGGCLVIAFGAVQLIHLADPGATPGSIPKALLGRSFWCFLAP